MNKPNKRITVESRIELGQMVYLTDGYAPRFRWLPKFARFVPGLRVKVSIARPLQPKHVVYVVSSRPDSDVELNSTSE